MWTWIARHRLRLVSFIASLLLVLGFSEFSWPSLSPHGVVLDAFHSWEAEGPSSTISEAPKGTRKSNGLTDLVEWDEYSLFVKNQRVFIWSGEFHTWRLPVPDLWLDILEKIKAAGLNTVSIYVHWGLVNPSRGVFDFNGYRALQPLFDAAKDVGLWLILRPGPYINAETSAGGIPHWVTSEVHGHLRTNDSSYTEAWVPYIRAIIELTRDNQISAGGPIIAVQVENEYVQDPDVGYPGKAEMMRDIERELRDGGIVVPLTFNDAYRGGNFVTGLGAVDLYGLDSYPQGFDCSRSNVWNPVVENYFDYHMSTNPDQPFFTPEFQAGAYDAWGPGAPGYAACEELTGPQFESVFHKNLWANNFKMINLYMIYGGTTFGHLPFPGVYTSYDYGAAISESREIGSAKYAELKRQAMFVRSSPEFYKTNVIGNSSKSSGVVRLYGADEIDAFVTLLSNPDTGARFYIARHLSSVSADNVRFKLGITTSLGEFLVPQTSSYIGLLGRDSKLIACDLTFGNSSHLLYSTASILWAGKLGDRDALFLYGDSGLEHEAVIKFKGQSPYLGDRLEYTVMNGGFSLVNIARGVTGLVTIWDSSEQIVLFSDMDTTATMWFPVLPIALDPFSHYWQFGTNRTILVGGPYLVRSAGLSGPDDTVLELRGDLKDSVRLVLIGIPTNVRSLTWNGQPVEADLAMAVSNASASSIVQTVSIVPRHLDSPVASFEPPVLKQWKYANGLPEIGSGFSDLSWVMANHTSTNIPYKPYGNGTVLYGCDYGFCEGAVLFRGHFFATGFEESVNLIINGGAGFAASVWLNEYFLGTSYGNSTNNLNVISETNDTFAIPRSAILDGENVMTVLQDNMGLDETKDWDPDASKSPRGIRYYGINGGSFSYWRIQGKLGGYTAFFDTTRGLYNEGGTYGEREGWHLPGYNVSSWEVRNLEDGLPEDSAGLGFFVNHFTLNIPEGYDIPISFAFEETYQPFRLTLWINGWLYGKCVANLGPQFKFPVPQGILDYTGTNTVAVLLWSLENKPISPKLSISFDATYDGGVGHVGSLNPSWKPRTA